MTLPDVWWTLEFGACLTRISTEAVKKFREDYNSSAPHELIVVHDLCGAINLFPKNKFGGLYSSSPAIITQFEVFEKARKALYAPEFEE